MLKQNDLSDILCLRTTKGKGGKEMLTMSQINDIRDLSQKGYSISKISSLTGLDRKTVRKYLNQDDFSPQPPVAKQRTSIVTPCKSSACPRQKHVIQGLYVNWREPIFSLPRCMETYSACPRQKSINFIKIL